MYAYTVILILVTGVRTQNQDDAKQLMPNVGTVLFRPENLLKPHWSKTELSLLEARRHFQMLIPPPDMVNPTKDFVDKLIAYFRDAYSAIQKEATNSEVDSILTLALSDTIGGYLKLWILPVTKFAFYGGVISKENSYRLFNLYNEVKRYLGTDGEEWRGPDADTLRTIALGIPRSPHVAVVRSYEDPCENFAYFEKTPSGLTIPIPYINWNDETMFVPLKNHSLIPLRSSEHHNIITKYYGVAKDCLRSKSPNASSDFDDRFQVWLSKDIIPHLADENLYVALGSVLSLLNRTALYELDEDCQHKCSNLMVNKGFFCSNKIYIVGIILFLEVIWCICAMSRTPSTKDDDVNCCRQLFLFLKSNPNSKGSTAADKYMEQSTQNVYTGKFNGIRGGGLKLYQRPRGKTNDMETQHPSPSISIKYSIGTDTCSYTVIDESRKSNTDSMNNHENPDPTQKKNINIEKDIITTSQTKNNKESCSNEHKLCICESSDNVEQSKRHGQRCEICHSVHKIEKGQIVTLYKKCQENIGRAICSTNASAERFKHASVHDRKKPELTPEDPPDSLPSDYASVDRNNEVPCKSGERSSVSKTSEVNITVDNPSNDKCPCVCCTEQSKCSCTLSKKLRQAENETVVHLCPSTAKKTPSAETQITETLTQTLIMSIDKETDSAIQSLQRARAFKVQETKPLTLHRTSTREIKRSSPHKYFEIKIDRPDTEISVGISGVRGKVEAGTPRQHVVKESRIPKRKKNYSPPEIVLKPVKDQETVIPHVVARSTAPSTTGPLPCPVRPLGPHTQPPTKNATITSTSIMKHRSMIPQLKKRTVDDIIIKSKKPMIKDSKLNVTL